MEYYMENIYIFGRGNNLRYKYNEINNRYNVLAILDNSIQDESYDEEYNLKVYNPGKIISLPKAKIMCVSTFFVEMWQQLLCLQVDDELIDFGCNIAPLKTGIEYTAFSNGEKLIAKNQKLVYVIPNGEHYTFTTMEEFKFILRKVKYNECSDISTIAKLSAKPVSRNFGSERGKAVDRYYIEEFLNNNREDIHGCVMEIADNTYTKKYGENRVNKSIVLHVKGWGKNSIKGNLETGEGLSDEMVDCLICTQTLQYIYDVKSAMKNILKILKPGGVALVTLPGIKSLCLFDDEKWGEKWSFTVKSAEYLCHEIVDKDHYKVDAYGNVKVAIAYLYGLCCEDMSEEDFKYNDPQFPFLITVRIRK